MFYKKIFGPVINFLLIIKYIYNVNDDSDFMMIKIIYTM